MYLRNPILPNETELRTTDALEYGETEIEEAIDKLEKVKEKLTKNVSENLDEAKNRQKDCYDRRHNVEQQTYTVGEKVVLKNFRRRTGLATVEQIRYIGPLKVIKFCGKGNYLLLDESKDKRNRTTQSEKL